MKRSLHVTNTAKNGSHLSFVPASQISTGPDRFATDHTGSEWTRSCIEKICECDRAIAFESTQKLLAVLLSSAASGADAGCDALRPFWVMEAMQRCLNILKLMLMKQQRMAPSHYEHVATGREFAVAAHLAGCYQSIADAPERQPTSCSFVLRSVVDDLVALFGPAVGTIELEADIDCLMLPAFQTRALVLAASDLVMTSLLRGFIERNRGQITVALRVASRNCACLTVADDGNRCETDSGSVPPGIAHDLAGLLASSVVLQTGNPRGTTAKITFPLHI
jgi:hypothetical protein